MINPARIRLYHIKSLIKWWHWERLGLRLQSSAWDPRVSTDAPQTQWYDWQISELNLRPTATLITSSFRRSPHTDIGTAWSQSPLWAAAAARIRTRVVWLLSDWKMWPTTTESNTLWLLTWRTTSAGRPDNDCQWCIGTQHVFICCQAVPKNLRLEDARSSSRS